MTNPKAAQTMAEAEQRIGATAKARKAAAAALRKELTKRAAGGLEPKARESEDGLHMRQVHHLHQLLPGANPRQVQKAAKAVRVGGRIVARAQPAAYEPAHPWAMWWHTPNQGQRSLVTGDQFRRMGMRKGFADFGFAFRLDACRLNGPQHALEATTFAQLAVIEVKTPDGVFSSEQERFRADCERLGIWWAEARSVTDVDTTLRGWLDPWGLSLPRVRIME